MERINKQDLKKLQNRIQVLDARIEDNEVKMGRSTVNEYLELRRLNNDLIYKKMAAEDAISRLMDKNFSKNLPETSYSLSTFNR